ncbi:MAG: hypothetical protein AABX00_06410 [Nanoarchaeota archaeon]
MMDKNLVKKNRIFLMFFLIGVVAIVNFIFYIGISKKNAPLSAFDNAQYCVNSIFSVLTLIPYYILQFVPYFKSHISVIDLTTIPIILYSIVFLIFYIAIGLILNWVYNKNKILYKKIIILLIIIFVIMVIVYSYIGCFFKLSGVEL